MSGDGVTRRWHVGAAGIFRGSKAQTYEGGVRVPFIAYWKGHIRPGVLFNPISNVDVLPTLAEWTQAPLPKNKTLDGQSIADLLTGDVDYQSYPHRPIYLVNNGKVEAVRDGEWKYREIVREKGVLLQELFHLSHDPSERVNLLEQYPERVKELKVLFDSFPGYSVN
jgi:arylsulfatase A-like enzyme